MLARTVLLVWAGVHPFIYAQQTKVSAAEGISRGLSLAQLQAVEQMFELLLSGYRSL